MVRLAEKAFAPGKPPFPLMHIDSKWKFKEMLQFRDWYAKEHGWKLIVESNEEAFKAGVGPFTHGSKVHTDLMKTQALLHGLDKHHFDAAFGGARRDEEKSRARGVSSPSATNSTNGTRKTSAQNCGTSITHVSTREKASACSRSPTGRSLTSGNISGLRTSPSCRSILPRNVPAWKSTDSSSCPMTNACRKNIATRYRCAKSASARLDAGR